MTKTVPVYWFWDGSISDEADSEFINKTISANISVSATIFRPFVETLISKAVLDTNVDFSQGASETNGQGLMMMNQTQNDEYPIVYYRGDVNNNNVIYAGYCWLIVRTTETGGVKLLFNGPVVENADGTESCTNYSGVGGVTANTNYTDVYAGNAETKFNSSYNSPVYVGYMYNDSTLYYDRSTNTLDVTGYMSHLSDNTIDSTTGRHVQNLKDSTAKSIIDDWYEENLLNTYVERLLEDTVWCNDRSIISINFPIENYAANKSIFMYSASTRLGVESLFILEFTSTIAPSLACSRDMDKFTVDSANGNGDLTYPIGMLTADEILMAGNTLYQGNPVITYLSIPTHYFWALSPSDFFRGDARVFYVYVGGLRNTVVDDFSPGVRACVSLGLGAKLQGGDGSFKTPYNFDVAREK